MSAFEIFRRLIVKRRMEALAIVKGFEIGEDHIFSFGASAESMAIDALGFERTPKTLHWRIIKTIMSAAQTDLEPKLFKDSLILSAGILRTSIRMMQQSRLRLASA